MKLRRMSITSSLVPRFQLKILPEQYWRRKGFNQTVLGYIFLIPATKSRAYRGKSWRLRVLRCWSIFGALERIERSVLSNFACEKIYILRVDFRITNNVSFRIKFTRVYFLKKEIEKDSSRSNFHNFRVLFIPIFENCYPLRSRPVKVSPRANEGNLNFINKQTIPAYFTGERRGKSQLRISGLTLNDSRVTHPPNPASKLARLAGKFPSSIKVTRKIFLYLWMPAIFERMPGLKRGQDLSKSKLFRLIRTEQVNSKGKFPFSRSPSPFSNLAYRGNELILQFFLLFNQLNDS